MQIRRSVVFGLSPGNLRQNDIFVRRQRYTDVRIMQLFHFEVEWNNCYVSFIFRCELRTFLSPGTFEGLMSIPGLLEYRKMKRSACTIHIPSKRKLHLIGSTPRQLRISQPQMNVHQGQKYAKKTKLWCYSASVVDFLVVGGNGTKHGFNII